MDQCIPSAGRICEKKTTKNKTQSVENNLPPKKKICMSHEGTLGPCQWQKDWWSNLHNTNWTDDRFIITDSEDHGANKTVSSHCLKASPCCLSGISPSSKLLRHIHYLTCLQGKTVRLEERRGEERFKREETTGKSQQSFQSKAVNHKAPFIDATNLFLLLLLPLHILLDALEGVVSLLD